jgi:membrane-associated phospholipid phosphatase
MKVVFSCYIINKSMIKKKITTLRSKWLIKIFLTIVIILYVLVLLLQPKGYYKWYPTIPIYPDNDKEIDFMVNEYISQKTQDDIDFFYLTDDNPINAFKSKISEELYKNLSGIVRSCKVVSKIIYYKIIFNRARPMQVAPKKINAPKSMTANNPSYPSGHAYQSYYAAKLLSRLEPARKKEWDEIAERAAYIRVYMGIHYPSDVRYAKLLVDNLEL